MKRKKKSKNYKCVVCYCSFTKPKVDKERKSKYEEESSKVFDAFCTLLNLNPNNINDTNNETISEAVEILDESGRADARAKNISQEEEEENIQRKEKTCPMVSNQENPEDEKNNGDDNDNETTMISCADIKSEPSSPEHDCFEASSSNIIEPQAVQSNAGKVQKSAIQKHLEHEIEVNDTTEDQYIKTETTDNNDGADDNDDEYMPSDDEEEDNDEDDDEDYNTCRNRGIISNTSRRTRSTRNNPNPSVLDTSLNDSNNITIEKDRNHVESQNNNTFPEPQKPKRKRGRKPKYPRPSENEVPRVIKKRRRFVVGKRKFHFVDAEGFIVYEGIKIQVINNNKFKCCSCGNIYLHRLSAYNHIAHTHSDGKKTPHECTICDRKFRIRSLLEHHLRKHQRPSYQNRVSHKCGFCNVPFSGREDLRNHISEYHRNAIPPTEDSTISLIPDKPRKVFEKCPDRDGFMCGDIYVQVEENGWYRCSICTEIKTFKYRHHMVRHIIISHSDKSEWVKCPLCEKLFPEAWELKTHISEVHEARVHTCPVCTKTGSKVNYSSSASLRVHMRSHSREELDALNPNRNKIMFRNVEIKPVEGGFVCSKCPNSYIYKLKHSLNTHIIRHHQDRSNWIPCEVCGKQFMSPGSLRLHMQLHENERNFKCDLCDKAFNRKNTLYIHKKFHDRESLPFPCPHCTYRFHAKGNLAKHILTHAHTRERPFQCRKCEKSYTTKETLMYHTKTKHVNETSDRSEESDTSE